MFDGPLFQRKSNKDLRKNDPGYSVLMDKQSGTLLKTIHAFGKELEAEIE